MKVYYEKRVSQKTQRPYDCIVLDLGWKSSVLSFDAQLIRNVLNLNEQEMYELPVGYRVDLGELYASKKV